MGRLVNERKNMRQQLGKIVSGLILAYPDISENMTFSPFLLQTYRMRIVFAHPHENAQTNNNNTVQPPLTATSLQRPFFSAESPYILVSTSLQRPLRYSQWPLSFVPKVDVVDRFNCNFNEIFI